MTKVESNQIWLNDRRGVEYRVLDTPEWSDSPVEDNLEQWVYLMNMKTGKRYVRSLESFQGMNRDGKPRFTFVK